MGEPPTRGLVPHPVAELYFVAVRDLAVVNASTNPLDRIRRPTVSLPRWMLELKSPAKTRRWSWSICAVAASSRGGLPGALAGDPVLAGRQEGVQSFSGVAMVTGAIVAAFAKIPSLPLDATSR
jgi:hypothetical protein